MHYWENNRNSFKTTLFECAQLAGRILLEHSASGFAVKRKENQSSVVTTADLASEKAILEIIRSRFPDHGIICEETGHLPGSSPFTWVVDPLDGTSNFAAGVPWWGVLLALLDNGVPRMAIMHVPAMQLTFFSEAGQGVWRNQQVVRVSPETSLSNVLCAFAMDVNAQAEETGRQVAALGRVIKQVRNFRCSNCLLDLCFTVDGRFGACVNYNTKIWDIAPFALMLPEAGGVLTDVEGAPIRFCLNEEPFDRNYTILGANPVLHPLLLNIVLGR